MNVQKHFTVSVFIVHKNRVLLHLHKKNGMLLPVGGHVEPNELPEEACIREVKEETGLSVKLFDGDTVNQSERDIEEFESVEKLLRPMHMILCKVSKEHYHIDLDYYATADSNQIIPLEGESTQLYWYTKEELDTIKDAPKDVIVMAKEALGLLATK